MKELFESRKLIWKLSKNDFKTRYAGSYLGIVWAFVQPVVTILVYWFVFEKALDTPAKMVREGIDIEIPYLLHLMAGLVPWFFFSEALINGTTSLLEYHYLVKKVVFKISILPFVKIIAASFIHIFFVCFMLIVCILLGQYPTIAWIQILYYSAAMFLLVMAISYTTSAVVIFFRDLTQIVSIGLQVGMWATPILWDISALNDHPVWMIIFKLNPVYYIVNGYRTCLFEGKWFWEQGWLTLYFWFFVIVMFLLGRWTFSRLKPHFADIL